MASRPRSTARRSSVVAVGASAGGLESLGEVLSGLPAAFPAAVLVALHLDPDHRSFAVPLLQRRTRLRVVVARSGARVRPGTVFVAPPDRHLEVRAGRLRLTQAPRVNHSRPSVDTLLRSVAAAYGSAAIGVILSGAGRDGAQGLAAVKAAGGLAVVEDPGTARFAAMPAAAALALAVDATLPAEQIPPYLLRAVGDRVPVGQKDWLRMLDLLESRTGTRFSRYRSSTLHRRLQHRLAATGSPSMADYLRRLQRDAGEAAALKAAFLIKVSSFRRDAAAWKALDRELASALRAPPSRTGRTRREDRPLVRAWSAGCATGEEAYSLAMLLARRLGSGPAAPWKVFATDLDDDALRVARAGRYTAAQVAHLPAADLRRHFQRDGTAWRVRKELRAHVVFGRHDLLNDPPLPGIDVMACRNVLTYFQAEERERALRRLGSSVRPGGLLFLGQSEGGRQLPGFQRIRRTTLFRRTPLGGAMAAAPRRKTATSPAGRDGHGALAAALAGSATVAAVGTDSRGRVQLWNRAAEAFFGRPARQALGKPLAKAVGADAARRLRGAAEGGTVRLEAEAGEGPARLFEATAARPPLQAVYLGAEAPESAAPSRSASHVTAADARPRHRTARARMEAQQELNEELQSRNEELETVNEELQSLNDELTTMEEQMRGMAEESRLNGEFLRLLLDTSPDALIACDHANRVAFWSKSAVRRFRLSALQAVGGELFDLVPDLARRPLRAAARAARDAGRGGRITVRQDEATYIFDPLPAARGARRGYLLRIHPTG